MPRVVAETLESARTPLLIGGYRDPDRTGAEPGIPPRFAIADAAQPLTAEGMDDAIAESLRDRLEAIGRALHRLDAGMYGRSFRSGEPIPDERLEADPAAELTIEEARAAERG
ncbi:MAG: TraR/DksA family transcriptional regulator [Streptosporangiaceae bacterium]